MCVALQTNRNFKDGQRNNFYKSPDNDNHLHVTIHTCVTIKHKTLSDFCVCLRCCLRTMTESRTNESMYNKHSKKETITQGYFIVFCLRLNRHALNDANL